MKRMLDFADACARVEDHLWREYRIRVITRNVPDPSTGDLDGAEIHIDFEVDDELRLFLLAHLFGHTVQWNASPRSFELGRPHTPPVREELIAELVEYEREAARYGLSLLRDAGIFHLDQWFSDFTACDMDYLANYYRTGVSGNFREFWSDGADLMTPGTIPEFEPAKRVFRLDGIVI